MRTMPLFLILLLAVPVASAARYQQYEVDLQPRTADLVVHLVVDGDDATAVRRWADADSDREVTAAEVAALNCGYALPGGALRGSDVQFDGYASRLMAQSCTFDGLAGPTEGGARFTGQVRVRYDAIRAEPWLVVTIGHASGGTLLARASDAFRIAHHAGLTSVAQDGASVQGETSRDLVELRSYAVGTSYVPEPEPAPPRIEMTFTTPSEMRYRLSFDTPAGVHALRTRAAHDADASGHVDDAEYATFRAAFEPTLSALPNHQLAGAPADTMTLDRFVAEGILGPVDATGSVRIDAEYTFRWPSAPPSPLYETSFAGSGPVTLTMQAPSGHVLTGVAGIGVGTSAQRLEAREPAGRIQVRIEPAPSTTPPAPAPAAPTPEPAPRTESPAPVAPEASAPAPVAAPPSEPAAAPVGEAPGATSDARRTPAPGPGLALGALALLAFARRGRGS